MKLDEYPKVTVILRNVPRHVVDVVVGTIDDDELDLAVEITRNSVNFGDVGTYVEQHPRVRIGAGTVLTHDDARAAIDAGCQFVLSPVVLEEPLVTMCKAAGLLVVPGAYTPTEIHRAVASGADIVKLFPVRDLSDNYVRDIKAPLGDVPIMGVGGVTVAGMPALFASGLDYVGIGAGLLGKDLESISEDQIRHALHGAVEAAHSAS